MHNDDPFEDDYVPDDLVAVSGDEFDDDAGEQNTVVTDTEETGSSPQEDPTASAKKRKRREKEKEKKIKVCSQ
jgi:protein CMS1